MTIFYNFPNRETWLINLYFEFYSKQGLLEIKNNIFDMVEDIENDFLKDFIDLGYIDWKYLRDGLPQYREEYDEEYDENYNDNDLFYNDNY